MKRNFTSLALLVFTLVWVVQARSSGTTPNEPRQIVVTAKRFAYAPSEITLKKGEPVDLVLKSADVPHGLRITELGVDLMATKHNAAETKFTPDTTGDFTGHCSVFCGEGHGGMAITIHVTD